MKKLLIALAAVIVTVASYGQGQVVFSNITGVNAPVTFSDDNTKGPGPNYTAQLFLSQNGSFTALTPPSTFRAAGTGAAAIADRYWNNQIVDVPVAPGTDATFIVRAWQTSAGGYDAATSKGQSAPFTVTVGGGTLPPPNLTTLAAFTVTPAIPEPTIIALGVLGASALFLRRRK